jgi:hypothetical protein
VIRTIHDELLELQGLITNNKRQQGSALKNMSINIQNQLLNEISGWNAKTQNLDMAGNLTKDAQDIGRLKNAT